jgi:hypothetical protein
METFITIIYLKEFDLLQYALSSARILFRDDDKAVVSDYATV